MTQNFTTIDGVSRNLWYQYDAAGNRTQVKYPDSKIWNYSYGVGGQFNQLTDQTGNVLADFNYNVENKLTGVARFASAPDQNWSYDPIGRLASTGWADAGANSVSWSFTRNPASQILTETQSNDAYSWNAFATVDRDYQTNGLNQYTSAGSASFTYDANGNLTSDGAKTYLYDVENRLVRVTEGAYATNLYYDPMGRLVKTSSNAPGFGTITYLHDGDALVAEYNSAGTMLQRHVHGPAAGVDDPLVTYIGTSNAITSARFLYADSRGSIVYSSTSTNGTPVINTYDVYGIPGTGNSGRFQYTGQVWLPEIGLYYYKARIYSPSLGRFLQTDPIGYKDNVHLYAYVGDDPVNGMDPTGLAICGSCSGYSTDGISGSARMGIAKPKGGETTVVRTEEVERVGKVSALQMMRKRNEFDKDAKARADAENGAREYGTQVNSEKSRWVIRLLRGPKREGKRGDGRISAVDRPGTIIYFSHVHPGLYTWWASPWFNDYKGRPLTSEKGASEYDKEMAEEIRREYNKDIVLKVFYREFYIISGKPGPWLEDEF